MRHRHRQGVVVASKKTLFFDRQFAVQADVTPIVTLSVKLCMQKNVSVCEWSVGLGASDVLATRSTISKPW
jgi:hypothetical protein